MSRELQAWIQVMQDAVDDALPQVEKVVSRGAVQIKKDWANRWRGHPHISALPWAINYDLHREKWGVWAEIGADRSKKQGKLANLIEFEFGSVKSHPIPAGMPALDAEEPKFVRALAELGEKLLEGKRL